LPGDATSWTKIQNQSELNYTNGSTTVNLKNVESVSFYKIESIATTHSRIDLLA